MTYRDFSKEKPQPFKSLIVKDNKGVEQGYLGTKIIWDGHRFATDLAHILRVDTDNIVEWCYLEELHF